MKLLKYLFYTLLIMATITSCDEVDERTEFDVNSNASIEVIAKVIQENFGEPPILFETAQINIAEEERISDNFDKIESIQINSISYRVFDYSGPDENTITNPTLKLGNQVVNLQEVNLNEANNPEQFSETINDNAFLNYVANVLQQQPVVDVEISGGLDEAPADFKVEITIDFTATVDAI